MNPDNDKNRNSNWNSFILIQDFPENICFHILLVRILVALNRIDGLFAARKRKDPIGIIWTSDSCFGVPSKATRKQGLQTFRDVQAVSNLLLLILNKLNAVKVGLTFGSYLLLQTR